MKGKIEAIQSERTSKKGRYEVSLIITIKKGLKYKRSEELLTEFREKYLGNMVEIWPILDEAKPPY